MCIPQILFVLSKQTNTTQNHGIMDRSMVFVICVHLPAISPCPSFADSALRDFFVLFRSPSAISAVQLFRCSLSRFSRPAR